MAKAPFREKVTTSDGVLTRMWHRFFNSLEDASETAEAQPYNDVAELYSVNKTTSIQNRLDLLEKKIELLITNRSDFQKKMDFLDRKIETMLVKGEVNYQKQIDLLNRKIELLTNNKDWQKQLDVLNRQIYT